MRDICVVSLAMVLSPLTLCAQDNPFALTGGKVKSAYIVYEMTGRPQAQGGFKTTPVAFEMGVTPDRYIIRTVAALEAGGVKDTMNFVVVSSRDSQYTYTKMSGEAGGEVTRTLRPHLAREYAALDAAGKARFKENFKLATKSSMSGSSSAADQIITLTGDKKGSETIAGQTCDVYQRDKITACVLPGAPMVFLRWTDATGAILVAKKVSLNGPVPAPSAVLPKGVTWKTKGYDEDAEFASQIWSQKKQSDPEAVPPATLAKFAVSYLASPAAVKELRETQGGAPEETGEAEPSDTSGS